MIYSNFGIYTIYAYIKSYFGLAYEAGIGDYMKRKKGFFSISAVAKMFSVHQQTIRLYEKEGLIAPKRSEGNTRLFSEEDVDKLEQVIYLTHELGINLAGVEMILKLERQIKKLQKEINKAFEATGQDLLKEVQGYKSAAQESAQKLITIKKPYMHKPDRPAIPEVRESSPASGVVDVDEWELEYEE
jgi:MerR family transcriptional regulator, heat shock protein HspR